MPDSPESFESFMAKARRAVSKPFRRAVSKPFRRTARPPEWTDTDVRNAQRLIDRIAKLSFEEQIGIIKAVCALQFRAVILLPPIQDWVMKYAHEIVVLHKEGKL